MNYHVRREGEDLGAFPLDELRRRREAGEFNGSERVWCEGMSAWQALDSVLAQDLPEGDRPPPVPAASAKSSGGKGWLPAAIVGGVIVLVAFAFLAVALVQAVKKARPRLEQTRRDLESAGEPALTLASRPVATNGLTEAKVNEQRREFRRRQYVEGYEKRGEHNPAYDAAAVGALKNWVASNFGGQLDTNLPPWHEVLEKLGSDPAFKDPLVLTISAVYVPEHHEAIRRLERALDAFGRSRHKAYPKFYATVTLAEKLHDDRAHRLPVLDGSARQFLREAFADGSLQPGDQAELGEVLVMGWGRNFFNRNRAEIPQLVRDQGEAFEWLALTLQGEFHIDEAWKARGGGFANTVTTEGWRSFSDHLKKARESLTRAAELRPDLPLAPSRMIYVALGSGGLEEMRYWFDRTVAAQIDYADAWKQMRWGLRPRWHGDLESMLAFGVTALETRRFDTDVPRVLYDSVTDLESELHVPRGEHIFGRPDIWPHLEEMYEGYLAAPSPHGWRDGWRSAYSIVAYFGGKYDVSRKQLETINWNPGANNLYNWGTDVSLLVPEVAARTSPAGRIIHAAEASRKSRDFAAALRLYGEAAAVNNLDERTHAFIQDRLATLALEQQLHQGGWISFQPDSPEKPVGWNPAWGSYKIANGALEVTSGQQGHLLYSRARVGYDFELKGRFEVVRSSTKAFQAGIVLGIPEFNSSAWLAFRMKRNADEGDVASFSQQWGHNQIRTPVALDSGTNSFHFRLEGWRVTASVNGKEVFQQADPPRNVYINTNEVLVGIGAYNDMNETVIRYRDLQIRKIPR